jgi:predicted transcriptional regulator
MAMIEEADAAIKRGEFVEHEEAIALLDEMIAKQEARCA